MSLAVHSATQQRPLVAVRRTKAFLSVSGFLFFSCLCVSKPTEGQLVVLDTLDVSVNKPSLYLS